ncbi:MAG: dTMP kinase, partial [Clostridium saudiense]|nr:dTMP kinase [Clostridium saudiense]
IIEIIGIDGSGKTSIANFIANNLKFGNFKFINPFEERRFIQEIDKISQKNSETKYEVFSNRLINMLWIADFFENYFKIVEPQIKRKTNIVFDRYLYSAYVYSKLTTNENMDAYYNFIRSNLPKPDVYIYLKIPVDIALNRIYSRKKPIAFYENFDYLNKISRYIDDDIKNLKNVITIDASMPFGDVCKEVERNICKRIIE